MNTVVQLEKIRVDLAQYKGEWNTFFVCVCVDLWAHTVYAVYDQAAKVIADLYYQ